MTEQRTCKQCGGEFSSGHPTKVYCSPNCRAQHWVDHRPEVRRESTRRYRENNREKVREANRRYASGNPDKIREHVRQFRTQNPEKVRAHWAVSHATRDGRLVRPEACEACGERAAIIHAHHTDYSRPLDVTWLCPLCHRAVHVEAARAA